MRVNIYSIIGTVILLCKIWVFTQSTSYSEKMALMIDSLRNEGVLFPQRITGGRCIRAARLERIKTGNTHCSIIFDSYIYFWKSLKFWAKRLPPPLFEAISTFFYAIRYLSKMKKKRKIVKDFDAFFIKICHESLFKKQFFWKSA